MAASTVYLDGPGDKSDNQFMKTKASLTLILLLLSAAWASASSKEWWELGYRPNDRVAATADLPYAIEANRPRRYMVNITTYLQIQQNPGNENVRMYMPLPADDAYQTVFLFRLSPEPQRILESRYGYRIAAYDFGPLVRGAMVTLNFDAEVLVGKLTQPINPNLVGTFEQIPEQIRQDYLIDGPLYRINDPEIQGAVREAVGGETNPYNVMAGIVRYVRRHLHYVMDNKKVDSVTTLRAGSGSCTEYSFLMIAMARAAGLPARYISGSVVKKGLFTHKSYDRAHHKIVEVYLPNIGWVPVESTGGDNNKVVAAPEMSIGAPSARMLFFIHEPEPGLAPLDPRMNILTHIPYNSGSKVKITRSETVQWTQLEND